MNEKEWQEFINVIGKCRLCHNEPHPLVEKDSHPLFMKKCPTNTTLLFIAEAPNYDDTYNKDKGYLTINNETDPSGVFMYKLLHTVLGLDESKVCVTNAVLCLPKEKNRNYPVNSIQVNLCIPHLISQIKFYDPKIVCTLGSVALNVIRKIEDHGYKSLKEAIGKKINWYGRILFPLYHTSYRARFGPTGRSENLQIGDWQALKNLYNELL